MMTSWLYISVSKLIHIHLSCDQKNGISLVNVIVDFLIRCCPAVGYRCSDCVVCSTVKLSLFMHVL